MAWRSSGTTNDEMVDNLKRFQVLSSVEIEAGFRNVDRRLFVPKCYQDIAHKDQPIRHNNIHISAPHIYGSVLEALELENGTDLSFLNAGSGTGYLTCIIASILGPRSVHYCVEIYEDVISHSKKAIAAWTETNPSTQGILNINIIRGNVLEVDTNKGECALGFDRIYIGAAIHKYNLHLFKKMLKPGGVLVGPVGDELVKIVRSRNKNPECNKQFETKVISGVRFAPLLTNPSCPTEIPAQVWDPSNHSMYPDSFRGACNELFLCSNARKNQSVIFFTTTKVNAASMLPRALWIEILSFAHRNWFDIPMNEVDILTSRLTEEQANVQRSNQARQDAETRCRIAERERDIYKDLARTLRSRLNSHILEGSNNFNEIIEENVTEIVLGRRDSFSIFGLEQVLRFVAQEGNDEDMEEEENRDLEVLEDTEDGSDMSEAIDDVEDGEEVDRDESISIASYQSHTKSSDSIISSARTSQNQIVSISVGRSSSE